MYLYAECTWKLDLQIRAALLSTIFHCQCHCCYQIQYQLITKYKKVADWTIAKMKNILPFFILYLLGHFHFLLRICIMQINKASYKQYKYQFWLSQPIHFTYNRNNGVNGVVTWGTGCRDVGTGIAWGRPVMKKWRWFPLKKFSFLWSNYIVENSCFKW